MKRTGGAVVAVVLAVVAGVVTTVPATSAAPPVITGTVVDASGAPVPFALVYLDDGAEGHPHLTGTDRAGRFEGETTAGANRVYVRADASAGLAAEWHVSTNSFATAAVVQAPGTGAVDIGTVVLTEGATVTGTVTTGGRALPWVRVSAETLGGVEISVDDTDRNGRYVVPHLAPGQYRLRFRDYYDNYVAEAPTAPVTVSEDQHGTGPDVDLEPVQRPAASGVDVTGVVTDDAGRPLPGITVVAFSSPPGSPTIDDAVKWQQVATDASGHYYLTELDQPVNGATAKAFRLEFSEYDPDVTVVPGEYVHDLEWYAGDVRTYEQATPVAVPAGGPATVDVSLRLTGHIGGTIKNPDGVVASGLTSVRAFDAEGHPYATAFTRTGDWDFYPGIGPGTYRLEIQAQYAAGILNWWDRAATYAEAVPVTVHAGEDIDLAAVFVDRVAALRLPAVVGRAEVGQTLTADPGGWNLTDPTTYATTWLADGAVVGSGTTYVVRSTDLGRRLVARVTAASDNLSTGHLTGTADSAPTAPVTAPITVPPLPPSTSPTVATPAQATRTTARARVRRTRVVLHVDVSASGGTVTVTEDGRVRAAPETVIDGRATVRIKKPAPGRHTYTVAYSGTATAAPSATRVKVRLT